jgi:lipopolysaccharide/colanic/teichoic acid biosynthesis glycosyltransferase
VKRAFDVIVSAAALLILAPLLAILAVAVKLNSPGPCFYRGSRVGRHGKPFRIIKFRSMVANAEQLGGSCTASDDARITGIGRFLRRYKLDEIPQLFNVLSGDMSLVGPRPEVTKYVNMFTPEESEILTVRPGITDWATLRNSDEEAILADQADPERIYLEKIRPEKLRLQLEYVHEHSFMTDLDILLRTSGMMVSRLLGFRGTRPGTFRESARNDR